MFYKGTLWDGFLFLYITDTVGIDNSVRFIIYADDITLLFTARDAADALANANHALRTLTAWSAHNPLKTNVAKTGRFVPTKKEPWNLWADPINLRKLTHQKVASVKSLGVFLDEHMFWNKQPELIIANITRVCGILNKCRYSLPKDCF